MAGPIRLALFDCDGTLVDSQGNICLAIERTFAEYKLPQPGNHAARRVVGLSLVEAMRALYPTGDNALLSELAACYRDQYVTLRQQGAEEELLYPGIAELIVRLDRQGWILGVATGKSMRGLDRVLGHYDLKKYFATLQVADHHPSKPHPSMIHQAMADTGAEAANVVMIGDTVFDMEMAANAGTPAIGVDWGYHEPDELTAAGATEIASTAQHLGELLNAMTASA